MFTTLDPGDIRGAKCCVNKNGAVILTPTVCCHSTDVISPNCFTTAMPALFTSRSSGSFPTSAMRSETPDETARWWIRRMTFAQFGFRDLHTSAIARSEEHTSEYPSHSDN